MLNNTEINDCGIIKDSYDFLKQLKETQEHLGACLIITGKQYVFIKYPIDEEQGKTLAVLRTILEMEGKNSDISSIDASKIYSEYDDKFLMFEIEINKDEKTFKAIMNYNGISKEELELFKMFYDEYREVLKKCNLTYSIHEKTADRIVPIIGIDRLLKYITAAYNASVEPPELKNGEKILGVPLNIMDKKQII